RAHCPQMKMQGQYLRRESPHRLNEIDEHFPVTGVQGGQLLSVNRKREPDWASPPDEGKAGDRCRHGGPTNLFVETVDPGDPRAPGGWCYPRSDRARYRC